MPPVTAPRRLLWIVNHRTLMQAEVPILRSLGWRVFVPKIVPSHHPEFRSAAVTHEFDAELGLPPETLAVLNAHDFYERSWPPTVAAILNRWFQAAIAHFSYRSLVEVSAHFEGRIIARAFGRESPRRYTEFLHLHPGLLQRIGAIGERFVFGQGYDNLAEVEAPELASRAHTIAVPLPAEAYRARRHLAWRRRGGRVPLPGDRGASTISTPSHLPPASSAISATCRM